jgi:hypothetical protein
VHRDSFHVERPLIGEVGIKANAHGKVPRAMPRCRCLSARAAGNCLTAAEESYSFYKWDLLS